MKIADLNGKTVCILGYGREGTAILSALEKFAPDAKIVIADKDESIQSRVTSHETRVGPQWLSGLEKFDVIIKSPGIPPNSKLETLDSKLTSSTQIFFDTIADSGAIVVGVTGSKGKSTTASLIYAILSTQDSRLKTKTFLVGNIGEPAIAHISEAKPGVIFVMEMSSYQLMDLTVSPHIAVITSFFPEHLDYHGSLESYLEAKKHITQFQKTDDMVFFNAASPETADIAKEGDGTKIPFTPADCPVDISETRLIGEHNCGNIAAACMVASTFGVDAKTMLNTVRSFKGLPHRLQSLGVHHGLEWIDDAISTTPQSAIAALDALGDRVEVMILGGQDRGYDFTPLAKRIKDSAIKLILLFPGSGPKIREALIKAKVDAELIDVDSMEEAVKRLRVTSHESREKTLETRNLRSRNYPIVLLSTASPSYGMFKNFEEKGDMFKQFIEMA
jgi:UDP-N-acetylmuramoyl-L-alanine---L-glutamate ligase